MNKRRITMWIIGLFAAGMLLSAAEGTPQRRRRHNRHSRSQTCCRILSHVVGGQDAFKLFETDGFRFATIRRGGELLLGLFTADYSQIEGYRGITNCLVLLNLQGVVQEVRVVESEDTPPYVKRLIRKGFLEQLVGLKPDQTPQVDAVSGATITCDAIRDSVSATLQAFTRIVDTVDFSGPLPQRRTGGEKLQPLG
ncbi:MAG: FMN-binding protein [Acidobacteriota bacterium]|jgi:transcriptional regulator of nitric oxide reductase|nr:FMN-binding protein [Acidobacteriota bacterium]